MPTQVSRVTVVGSRRRADLALPSHSPVADYIDRLVEVCGQDTDSAMPAAWTLATPAGPLLSPERSLADLRVADGQVLHLRDLTEEVDAGEAVEELEEVVAAAVQPHRWSPRQRGVLVALLGLAWLAGTAGYLGRATGRDGYAPAAATLAVLAMLLPGLAWLLAQRRTATPAAVVLLVSLSAVPCLAAAGAVIGSAMFGPGFGFAGAVVGANVAAVMALAATPEPVLVAVEVQLAAAGLAAVPLLVLHVGRVGIAATAVVVAVGLLAAARWLAATIVTMLGAAPRPEHAAEVTRLLVRGSRLLAVVVAVPALTTVVAGGVLAAAGGRFAVALAVLASVGLLGRSAGAGLGTEVAVLATAGIAGLFTDAVCLARSAGGGTLPAVALAAAGLLILGIGLSRAVRAGSAPDSPDDALTAAASRRTPAELLVTLCDIAVVPLALGATGVYATLLDLGRGLGS